MTPPHVHDLVQIADVDAVRQATPDAPSWVWHHLTATPWAVVRRPPVFHGHLPAGVRGDGRHERHAIDLPVTAITRVVTPRQLAARLVSDCPDDRIAAAVVAARGWFAALDAAGLEWGPVGAVGFALATGRRVTTATSDLDLIVRISAWPGPDVLWQLPRTPVRLDCLLESPAGAVAWPEAASPAQEVLWRTPTGPRLAGNPRLRPALSAG